MYIYIHIYITTHIIINMHRYMYMCVYFLIFSLSPLLGMPRQPRAYEVATISMLAKNIGLFCKRAL